MGYRTDVSLQTRNQGGGIAPFWGSAKLPYKVSRHTGYCSNSIAISRDRGPLSPLFKHIGGFVFLGLLEAIAVGWMLAIENAPTIRCVLDSP